MIISMNRIIKLIYIYFKQIYMIFLKNHIYLFQTDIYDFFEKSYMWNQYISEVL